MPVSRPVRLTFAAALCVTGAGCDLFKWPPQRTPAIGIQTLSGSERLRCQFTMADANLVLTSQHCVGFNNSARLVYHTFNVDGTDKASSKGVAVGFSSYWLTTVDQNAPQEIRDDPYYQEIALDKSLVVLKDPIADRNSAIETMPLAPLDSVHWTNMDTAGFQMAHVKLLANRSYSNGYTYILKEDCHMYRMTGMNEVVAHDCPTKSGISGTFIGYETASGQYALLAIHQGRAMAEASALTQAFSRALPKIRIFGFASTAYSFVDLCLNQVDNCEVLQKVGTQEMFLRLTN